MAPTASQPKPCVCKAKDQPSSTDVICCEKCHAWMHDVCIGIPASEFSRIDKYYCLLCIAKTPSLRITYSRPSMPSKSSTDALLEKLIEKLEALCDGLAKVSSRVDALEQQGSSAPAANRYGQPPQQPLDVASIVCKVMAEQQVAERKKTRAVLERVPVQSPEEDAELVKSLAEKCGVAADLIEEDIHRHGQEAEGRRRIMKPPYRDNPRLHSRAVYKPSFCAASHHAFWNRVINLWNNLPVSLDNVANVDAFTTFVQSLDATFVLSDPVFNYQDA